MRLDIGAPRTPKQSMADRFSPTDRYVPTKRDMEPPPDLYVPTLAQSAKPPAQPRQHRPPRKSQRKRRKEGMRKDWRYHLDLSWRYHFPQLYIETAVDYGDPNAVFDQIDRVYACNVQCTTLNSENGVLRSDGNRRCWQLRPRF